LLGRFSLLHTEHHSSFINLRLFVAPLGKIAFNARSPSEADILYRGLHVARYDVCEREVSSSDAHLFANGRGKKHIRSSNNHPALHPRLIRERYIHTSYRGVPPNGARHYHFSSGRAHVLRNFSCNMHNAAEREQIALHAAVNENLSTNRVHIAQHSAGNSYHFGYGAVILIHHLAFRHYLPAPLSPCAPIQSGAKNTKNPAAALTSTKTATNFIE